MSVTHYFDINDDNFFDLPFTLFMVASFANIASGNTIMHRGSLPLDDGAFTTWTNSDIGCGWQTNPPLGAVTTSVLGVSSNKFYIITINASDTASLGYMNVNTLSEDPTESTLAGYPAATALTARIGESIFDLCEILHYSGTLTALQKKETQKYLAYKWKAILGSL